MIDAVVGVVGTFPSSISPRESRAQLRLASSIFQSFSPMVHS